MNRDFKILNIDHIGIAVKSIEKTKDFFEEILGMHSNKTEFVKEENVLVEKVDVENSSSKIELIESMEATSVINRFISKKGEGIHHIALEIDNIHNAIDYLIDNKIKLIYEKPKLGSDNKLITFIHPAFTSGVLIELCQKQ